MPPKPKPPPQPSAAEGGALNADLTAILWQTVEHIAVTSGPPDRYGTVTDVEAEPVPMAAYFEVTSSEESGGTDRERRAEGLLVTAPNPGLRARDVIVVGDERWQVFGPPRTLRGLWAGAEHHTESTLVRVREGP